jgi:hypothetical protein
MTLSPYRKYMAHPKKYQFRDFVNLRLRERLGTFIMLTTSLKETTWRTVTTMITYKCPEKRARKKPAIMISVHIVRVIKVCFFFSKSDCGVLSYLGPVSFLVANAPVASKYSIHTSTFSRGPFR